MATSTTPCADDAGRDVHLLRALPRSVFTGATVVTSSGGRGGRVKREGEGEGGEGEKG